MIKLCLFHKIISFCFLPPPITSLYLGYAFIVGEGKRDPINKKLSLSGVKTPFLFIGSQFPSLTMKESCVQDFTQKNNLFDIIKSLRFKNSQSPLLICVFYVILKYDIHREAHRQEALVRRRVSQWEQRVHKPISRQKGAFKTE